MACYRARILSVLPELQAQGQIADDAEKVREAILSDLGESVRVSAQHALDAAMDADFVSVRYDPDFQAIVSRNTRVS
jgi:hypothetical protein